MKQAIFFDLDGTLWDATYAFKTVYDQVCNDLKIENYYTRKNFGEFMGSTPEGVIKKMCLDLGWDKEKSINFFGPFYLKTLQYLKIHGGIIFPDEEKTLSILSKQYDLYIVSNGSKGYVEIYLESSKLGKYFKGYLQAGDTNLNKADNIIKLKKEAKIDEVIYVGDTLLDFNECKKANVPFIHASYGFGKVNEYKYKLNKISDLIDIKDKLFQ